MRLRVVGESRSDDCLVSTVRFAMAWELIPRVATEGFVVGQRSMASKFAEIRGGMRRDQMSRIPAQRLSASNSTRSSTRRRATVAAMEANEYARAGMMER